MLTFVDSVIAEANGLIGGVCPTASGVCVYVGEKESE